MGVFIPIKIDHTMTNSESIQHNKVKATYFARNERGGVRR